MNVVLIARVVRRLVGAVAALVVSVTSSAPPPAVRAAPDPGARPQTQTLPSASDASFRARAAALWQGIVTDSPAAARAAFFPRGAYLQVKAIADPGYDYDVRLLGNFRADIAAAHALLGAQASRAGLRYVSIPAQWTWIPPRACDNAVGYWHAPGARLVYRIGDQTRSFGIASFISWRGQWYVVHLAPYDQPGTVIDPSDGVGAYGPPGSC